MRDRKLEGAAEGSRAGEAGTLAPQNQAAPRTGSATELPRGLGFEPGQSLDGKRTKPDGRLRGHWRWGVDRRTQGRPTPSPRSAHRAPGKRAGSSGPDSAAAPEGPPAFVLLFSLQLRSVDLRHNCYDSPSLIKKLNLPFFPSSLQIQTLCSHNLQRSPSMINIMKTYFMYRNKS